MHEEKIALVRRQIEALAAAVASRNIRHVWVVACGGSLATLDPFRYILTAETDKVSAAAVNAAEFAAELPKGLGEDCLVVLNSQSGTTAETVRYPDRGAENVLRRHVALSAQPADRQGAAEVRRHHGGQ